MDQKKKGHQTETSGKSKETPIVISAVRTNIRCRRCFMVDGYSPEEKRCRHCGAELFRIDAV